MTPTNERDPRLEAVILDYLKAKDAGAPPETEEFLARYPELRSELAVFLADQAKAGEAPILLRTEPPAVLTVDWPNRGAQQTGTVESFGDYQILAEIDRGGMGAIYRARQVSLNRDVAVKVLLADPDQKPAAVVRFFEEAQISGQLAHPGITPVYEVGRMPNGRPFFAMKLIQGKNLAALLAARPSLQEDLPRFLKIFEQIAQTIAYAHSREVLHRDLKPPNVMVGSFGEVLVMDWGLGKVVQDAPPSGAAASETMAVATVRTGEPGMATVDGAVMGTFKYMAPEQANGDSQRICKASDVFSLGSILCEILTGEAPYAGKGMARIWQSARTADLVDAFARLNGCGADPGLIQLARWCLAPRIEDRPANAALVAQATTGYLDAVQRKLRAAELGQAKAQARAAEEVKRRRVQFWLLGTLALFLSSGVAAVLYYTSERERRDREQVQQEERRKHLEEQADSQRYAGILGNHRARMTQMEPGWIDTSLRELGEAAGLKTPLRRAAELRTEIAATLMATGIYDKGRIIGHNREFSRLAVHPSGKWLAIGRGKLEAQLFVKVLIVDLEKGQLAQTLQFVPGDRAATLLQLRPAHEEAIQELGFSPDGNWLVAGSGNGKLYRWHWPNPEATPRIVPSKQESVEWLAFSPDSKTFYAASGFLKAGVITRWDLAEMKETGSLSLPSGLCGIALSPSGKSILANLMSGGGKEIDAESLRIVKDAPLTPSFSRCLTFSPDGACIAEIGGAGVPVVRQLPHYNTVREFRDFRLDTLETHFSGFRFSPDGRLFLVVKGESARLSLLDTANGQKILEHALHSSPRGTASMAFLPDSAGVLVAQEDGTYLYRMARSPLATTIAPHANSILAIALSPGGDRLACLSSVVNSDAEVTVWPTGQPDALQPRKRKSAGAQMAIGAGNPVVAFAPDGQWLAFTANTGEKQIGNIAIWNPGTGQVRPAVRRPAYCQDLGFDPEGRIWAALHHEFTLTNPSDGRLLTSWADPFDLFGGPAKYRTAVVKKGHAVLVGSTGRIRLLDTRVTPFRERCSRVLTNMPLHAAAESPDGNRLIVGDSQGDLMVLGAEELNTRASRKAHRAEIVSAAFLDNQTAISASRDRSIRFWRIGESELEELLSLQMPGPVRQAILSADTRKLYVLVEGECRVRRIDLENLWKRLRSFDLDPTDLTR